MNAMNRETGPGQNRSWMSLMAALWLGLFPLLLFGNYSTLTRNKWILMVILTALTLICFLTDCAQKRATFTFSIPFVCGILLLEGIIFSCILSHEPFSVWWMGASGRREGLAAQLCYLSLFFCFLFSDTDAGMIRRAMTAGLCAYAVIAVLQRAGQDIFQLYPEGRSYQTNSEFLGTIGNIDFVAGYCVLNIGWTLPDLFRQRGKQAVLSLVSLALSFILMWIISVQFSAIVLLGLACFTAVIHLPPRKRLLFVIAVILLLLLIVWFFPADSGAIWELREMMHRRTQLSFGSNRLAVWSYTLRMVSEQGLQGSGPDTFVLRFNRFLREHSLEIPDRQGDIRLPTYFDNPHNEYLAQLSNHGAFAMLLFMALMIVAVYPAFRGKYHPAMGGVLAYAIQAFFSFSFCALAPLFWVTLGIACAAEAGRRPLRIRPDHSSC